MQIAAINTEVGRGGAAKIALMLTEALAKQGHNITLYHTSDRNTSEHCVGLRRFASRQVNALLSRLKSDGVYDFGLAKDLLAYTHQADVLHLHNLHGYYLNYHYLLNHCQDRAIVWTWHDQWPITGRCGSPSNSCLRWQSGCGNCPHPEFYPSTWRDYSAQEYNKKTDTYKKLNKLLIVTPNNWLRDLAISRGFKASQVQVIPNPVQLDQFTDQSQAQARKKLGIDEHQPLVLFVASNCNDERKGYEDFADLVHQLKVPAIATGIPPKQRSAYIQYTDTLLDVKTLSDYYTAADLLIVPTKADNYPNVIIEAMACGTPVLAYNTGGIVDQMPDFWQGLIPFADLASLKSRCQNLLQDRQQLIDLRPQFRAHAIHHWHIQPIIEKYITVYQMALAL